MSNALAVVFPLYHLQTSDARAKSFAYVLKMVEERLRPTQVIISEQLKPGESRYDGYPKYDNLVHVTYEREGDAYCKAQAINLGVQQVTVPVLMILDADVALQWDAVLERTLTLERGTVLKPFKTVHRLNEAGTETFIHSGKTLKKYITDTSNVTGGGAVIMHKSDFIRVGGFDERYVGWGMEDDAFGRECHRYLKVQELSLPGFHLWHPRDKAALLASNDYNHNLSIYKSETARFAFDRLVKYSPSNPPPNGPLNHEFDPKQLGSCAATFSVFLPLVTKEGDARLNAIHTALRQWRAIQKWVPNLYIYEGCYKGTTLLKDLAAEIGATWCPVEVFDENLTIFQKETLAQRALQDLTEDRIACFDADVYSRDPYWLYKAFHLLTRAPNVMVQPMQWVMDTVAGRPQWSYAMQYDYPGEQHYHPGYGVAVNRKWFLNAGGFNVYCITGSGDNMLWGEYCPDTIKLSPCWTSKWIYDAMRKNVEHGKMLCPSSTLLHVWHGGYVQRSYHGSRYMFDKVGSPKLFVEMDPRNGLLRWKDPNCPVRRILARKDELVDIPSTNRIINEEYAR